jgi:glycosyltransferase involved in cell wall biosynthesis
MTDKTDKPLVSIALPVYNGARLIDRAIESILDSDLRDLELIITDNASDDDTERICRTAAAADSRVHYLRRDANIGAAPNFNDAFRRCRGKYFKWAAHDDELERSYLSRCIEVLEQDEGLVLCHTRAAMIDEAGNVVGEFDLDATFDQPRVVDRCRMIVDAYDFSAIWGVMRRDVVEKTRCIPRYCGSDRMFLVEMAMHGQIRILSDPLFRWRVNESCYRRSAMMTRAERWKWWDGSERAWPLRNTVGIAGHSLVLARHARVSFAERLGCLWQVGRWAAWPFVGRIRRLWTRRAGAGAKEQTT